MDAMPLLGGVQSASGSGHSSLGNQIMYLGELTISILGSAYAIAILPNLLKKSLRNFCCQYITALGILIISHSGVITSDRKKQYKRHFFGR